MRWTRPAPGGATGKAGRRPAGRTLSMAAGLRDLGLNAVTGLAALALLVPVAVGAALAPVTGSRVAPPPAYSGSPAVWPPSSAAGRTGC
ncbi:hypothetical protein ACFQ0B_57205 [Nonomuraea thailandensis]